MLLCLITLNAITPNGLNPHACPHTSHPFTIVEVGSHICTSTIWIATAMHAACRPDSNATQSTSNTLTSSTLIIPTLSATNF